MKSRIEVFLQNEIKNKQEIIGPEMVTHYLKDKFDEYQRKPIQVLEKQVGSMLESMYKTLNATNIHKSFYRKKDLIKTNEESSDEQDEDVADTGDGPIYDSDGNELVEHKSKNTMNDMLPLNVKAAEEKEKSESLIGKRTKSEADAGEPAEDEKQQGQKKRRKLPASYSQHMAE